MNVFDRFDRPIVSGRRPWWRHPAFPWGWISLSQDMPSARDGDAFYASGRNKPGDGGSGWFVYRQKRHPETNAVKAL